MREQVEAAGDGRDVLRETDALEAQRAVHEHFAHLDDAVVIGVIVGEVAVPLAVERQPHALLRRGARANYPRQIRGRIEPEIDPLVVVVRGVHGHVPREPRAVEQLEVDQHLMSPVLRGSDVLEQRGDGGTDGRGYRNGDQRVRRLLVVIGVVKMDAAAEQVGLESHLRLGGRLGLEVGIGLLRGEESGDVRASLRVHLRHAHGGGGERLERGRGTGLHAVRAVRAAEAQRIEPVVLGKEPFFRHKPRHARLGIHDLQEIGAEGAVLVLACRNGKEEPVAKGDLLLRVVAQCLDGRGLCGTVRHERRGRAERGGTDRQAATRRVQRVGFCIGVIRTNGRLEVGPRAWLPCTGAGQLRREVALVVTIVGHVAAPRRGARIGALVQLADVKAVEAEQVDTHRAFILHPGERTPAGLRAAGEALDVGAGDVLHDGAGRERVVIVQQESRGILEALAVRSRHAAPGQLRAGGTALPSIARLPGVEHADDERVVGLDEVARLAEARVHVEVHLGTQRCRHVRAEVHALLRARVQHRVRHGHVERVLEEADVLLRHLHRTEFIVEISAREEAERLRTTAHAHAQQAASAQVNGGVGGILEQVVAGEAVRLTLGALREGERGRCHGAKLTAHFGSARHPGRVEQLAEIRVRGLVIVAIGDRAGLARPVPARGARPSLLGGDHDDPVRRVGAIQRGGGGTLHDLDVLDFLGAQVVEHADGRLARRGERAVVVAHAIHHEDRRVAERDRGDAADADDGLAANDRRRQHDHARCLCARQQVRHGIDREFLDLLADVTERRNGIAQFDLSLLTDGGGHHFVQLDERLREREVDRRGAAIGDGDGLFQRGKPDAEHLHFHAACPHAPDGEAAVLAGDAEVAGANDEHTGLAEWLAGPGGVHSPGHTATLCEQRCGGGEQ